MFVVGWLTATPVRAIVSDAVSRLKAQLEAEKAELASRGTQVIVLFCCCLLPIPVVRPKMLGNKRALRWSVNTRVCRVSRCVLLTNHYNSSGLVENKSFGKARSVAERAGEGNES